jgi:hypothetical protein
MKIPSEPPVGNLIAYEYLSHSQATRREDGAKTYPTALLLARSWEFSSTLVYALGISHMPPSGRQALEVPAKLRRWIGLDERPQWIYTDEVNVFVWPGPDLRPARYISRRPVDAETCILGPLPNDWFAEVQRHFRQSYEMRVVNVVKRTP